MTKPYSPTNNSMKYTHVRLVKLQNCKISCTMGCTETNIIYDPLKAGKVSNKSHCSAKTVDSHITKRDRRCKGNDVWKINMNEITPHFPTNRLRGCSEI